MADTQQTDVEQALPTTQTPLLTITPVAAEKVRGLLEERELAGCALRVFVQGGGCSGLSYGMAFEQTIYPQDLVVESGGLRLVIDPTSLSYMEGAEIDYVDSFLGSGFAINNPQEVSTCGCGGHSHAEHDAAHAHDEGECGCGGSCGCGGHAEAEAEHAPAHDEGGCACGGTCGCGGHD